jgi:hypothetical protein
MKARRGAPKGSPFLFDPVTPLVDSEDPAIRF